MTELNKTNRKRTMLNLPLVGLLPITTTKISTGHNADSAVSSQHVTGQGKWD